MLRFHYYRRLMACYRRSILFIMLQRRACRCTREFRLRRLLRFIDEERLYLAERAQAL